MEWLSLIFSLVSLYKLKFREKRNLIITAVTEEKVFVYDSLFMKMHGRCIFGLCAFCALFGVRLYIYLHLVWALGLETIPL